MVQDRDQRPLLRECQNKDCKGRGKNGKPVKYGQGYGSDYCEHCSALLQPVTSRNPSGAFWRSKG